MMEKGQEVKFLKTAYDTVANRVAKLKEEGKDVMYVHAKMVMDDKKFFKAIKKTIKKQDMPAEEATKIVAAEWAKNYAEQGGDLMSKGATFDGEEIVKEIKAVKNK